MLLAGVRVHARPWCPRRSAPPGGQAGEEISPCGHNATGAGCSGGRGTWLGLVSEWSWHSLWHYSLLQPPLTHPAKLAHKCQSWRLKILFEKHS